MIKFLNKPSGITSRDFAEKLKKELNWDKICFSGRLDPMARGEMILLGNDSCKLMPQYNKHKKIYQFEICIGLQTDSDDPLGIIENFKDNLDNLEVLDKLKQAILNHEKIFYQNFHKFSSKPINGQPFWLLTKNNIKVDKIPNHKVEIYSIDVLEFINRSSNILYTKIINTIYHLDKKHKFRQEEIIKQWQEIRHKYDEKFINSIKVEMCVSSGFYVRQFVRDLADEINIPLMVYDINRIKTFV